MKTYPLLGPSDASGIYILKNKTTGHIYVGQSVSLKRRYLEWRTLFATRLGATNPALHEVIMATDPNDWEFVVFELCPRVELSRKEQEVILKVRASIGDLCINGTEPKIPREVTPHAGSVPLSQVLDENGAAMTYAQIAARCGVTHQAVKKRLAAWRRRGKIKINLEDLL